MKTIISKISIYAAAVMMAAAGLTACQDEPDRFELADGKPTVYYVRPLNAAAADSLLTGAYMGNSICIVGDNLRSVYQLDFNDMTATLNNSYITDHTILVDIPNEIPGEVSNMMYLITKNRDTVKFDFKVLVPGPKISSMKNEFATPGSSTVIYGDYFVDDPNVPIKAFIGNAECQIVEFTKTAITVKVPETATPDSPVKVSTIYGDVSSSFRWKDSRGSLFNFDNDPHPTNHGWHSMVIETDNTAIDGNFLRLGGVDVTMDEAGGWNDGNFSFEYWPGDWVEPVTYTGAPCLNELVDFSDWQNMSLKFELFVPSANPWKAASMQLIVAGINKITNTPAGILDVNGNTVAGANNTFFHDANNPLPRGLYTPWAATGSFDTGDEWITVTIPYKDFIYNDDGSISSGVLEESDFSSLTIFVWSGGIVGTECNPVIKIDNIRAVSNK